MIIACISTVAVIGYGVGTGNWAALWTVGLVWVCVLETIVECHN